MEIQTKLQAVDVTIFDEKQVTLVQDLTAFGLKRFLWLLKRECHAWVIGRIRNESKR